MNTPKNMVKIGDRVTCIRPESAYYSDYGGNPVQNFEPGMVGIVGAVDVPYVTKRRSRPDRGESFCCVDFEGIEHGGVLHRTKTWRVGLGYDNIKVIGPTTDREPVRKRSIRCTRRKRASRSRSPKT